MARRTAGKNVTSSRPVFPTSIPPEYPSVSMMVAPPPSLIRVLVSGKVEILAPPTTLTADCPVDDWTDGTEWDGGDAFADLNTLHTEINGTMWCRVDCNHSDGSGSGRDLVLRPLEQRVPGQSFLFPALPQFVTQITGNLGAGRRFHPASRATARTERRHPGDVAGEPPSAPLPPAALTGEGDCPGSNSFTGRDSRRNPDQPCPHCGQDCEVSADGQIPPHRA
jgi:hypothetical protein